MISVAVVSVGVALTYRKLAGAYVRHSDVPLYDISRYVELLSYEHDSRHAGAIIMLTPAGLQLGNDRVAGAWSLAGWLMEQEGWRGERSQQNVSEEIWAHCVAWLKVPALRGRANPVNIEFYSPWPRNLVSVAVAHARRAIRSRVGRAESYRIVGPGEMRQLSVSAVWELSAFDAARSGQLVSNSSPEAALPSRTSG